MTSYLKDLGPCPCVRPKSNGLREEETEAAIKPEDILPANQKDLAPKDEKSKRASNFLKEVLFSHLPIFLLKTFEVRCCSLGLCYGLFLSAEQVRGRLSSGEYKGFLECMKGLKNQTMSMDKLLQLVGNYFSAPERLYLLRRFDDTVRLSFSVDVYACPCASRHSFRF